MLCFDTETTGLNPEQGDEIIQLTFIDSDDMSNVYNEFFAPLNSTEFPEASAVTGLYYDQPVPSYPDGPLLCEYLPIGDPQAADIINEWLDSSYELMGYHVAFDVKMLASAGFDMQDHVYFDPMYAFAIYYWSTHPDEIYTTRSGKTRSPWLDWKRQYVNRNLTFAANHFGITFGAHDSSEDVRATILLYEALRDKEAELFTPGNFAFDPVTGDVVLDEYGQECFADENGNPLLYPDGYRVDCLFPPDGYTYDELMKMDS